MRLTKSSSGRPLVQQDMQFTPLAAIWSQAVLPKAYGAVQIGIEVHRGTITRLPRRNPDLQSLGCTGRQGQVHTRCGYPTHIKWRQAISFSPVDYDPEHVTITDKITQDPAKEPKEAAAPVRESLRRLLQRLATADEEARVRDMTPAPQVRERSPSIAGED